MKTWIEPRPVTVPAELQAAIGGHPIVVERLVRQGFTDSAAAQRFLDPELYTPASPDALPDMQKAVSRLRRAITDDESILIWGDFDVDGQTSTALLVAALRELGATIASHIPNRFTEGHGIFLPTLKTRLAGHGVLLTCDTGITAHDAVSYAQGQGVDVIITDHHSLAKTLPDAYAIINPMRLAEGHVLRELPGVGVAYQLIRALYEDKSSEHLLDLVAMGIVADVMVQVDDTRYWLQRGLDVLRHNPRAGLRAIMERADINPEFLTEMDIGFGLAPRLNALGRLTDANPSTELLTTDNPFTVTERVNELEGLNQKRRFLTRQVYEAAKQQIELDSGLLKYAVLLVSGEGWHSGVVGIVASRLVEDYARPVIVFSESEGHLHGSARSIAGINIIAAIRSQADLLDGFGGHSMAAGMRLKTENFHLFQRGLSQTVREITQDVDLTPEIRLDAVVDFVDIDLDFAEDIARLAPFGNGNPPPVLMTENVTVKSKRKLGSRGDHLEVRLVDSAGIEQRVLWWGGDASKLPKGAFDIAYTVRANMFKGKREALIEWIDARPRTDSPVDVTERPARDIIDYRTHADPQTMLAAAREQYPDALIFAEGNKVAGGVNRFALDVSPTLIIWTVPSDASTWQAILEVTQAERLILFGNYPRFTQSQKLIQHLMGMGKFAHNQREGIVTLDNMLDHTALSINAIRAAIRWINRHSSMQFTALTEDDFQVTLSDNAPSLNKDKNDNTLPELLQRNLTEIEHYRRYWLKQSQF